MVDLKLVESDTKPYVRWNVTVDGVATDISGAAHSAVLYYYVYGGMQALWKQTLAKGGSGVSSYFEYRPSAGEPYYPAGYDEIRQFYGDVLYANTDSPTTTKWIREALHVHVYPRIDEP
jgi:hypothetical protein